jgi:hypothetical protein
MFALLGRREQKGAPCGMKQVTKKSLNPRGCPMPQPIICLDAEVRHFAERFCSVFSKPQDEYFVTVVSEFRKRLV